MRKPTHTMESFFSKFDVEAEYLSYVLYSLDLK